MFHVVHGRCPEASASKRLSTRRRGRTKLAAGNTAAGTVTAAGAVAVVELLMRRAVVNAVVLSVDAAIGMPAMTITARTTHGASMTAMMNMTTTQKHDGEQCDTNAKNTCCVFHELSSFQ